MSTITITIDTEHLDHQAALDISSAVLRSVRGAEQEARGARMPLYPLEVAGEEAVFSADHHVVARFRFDKNKPKL